MTILLLFLLALSLLSLRALVHTLRDDGYGQRPAPRPPYAA
jgi:hypothetical protein